MSWTRYLVFLNLWVGRNQSWMPCSYECALGEKPVFSLSWSQQRLLGSWTTAFFSTVLSAFTRKATRRACQWVAVVKKHPRVQNCRFGKVVACKVSTDSAKTQFEYWKPSKEYVLGLQQESIPDPFHFDECMWGSNQEEIQEWMYTDVCGRAVMVEDN